MFEVGTPDQIIGDVDVVARVEVNVNVIAVQLIKELDLTLEKRKNLLLIPDVYNVLDLHLFSVNFIVDERSVATEKVEARHFVAVRQV